LRKQNNWTEVKWS